MRFLPCLLLSLFLIACNRKPNNPDTSNQPATNSIPLIQFDQLNSFPHDTTSFTEGLLLHEGKLYESTGATDRLPQTRSLFGIVDLKTGKIDVKAELDREKYFGEGISFLNGKVFQLTYQTKVGFIYDAVTFKRTGEFALPVAEGWGLTTDGTSLIMSDGTNMLTYMDPRSLQATKSLSVSQQGYAVDHLNELEYIKGFIFANIWGTNKIVKVDPADGKVYGELGLTTLATESKNLSAGSLEMNGIAYDSAEDKLFVTGKMWPKIYEIKIR